jgi:uncharacterized protein involved in exopolysaccharide biosynthesis
MKSLFPAFVLVLGLALAGCGWNPFHRMYSATAKLQFIPPISDVQGLMLGGEPTFEDLIAAEIKFMQSPDILTPSIQRLKLDQIWAKRFKSDHDPLSPQNALDHLRKILRIKLVSQTNIINVTAYSEVPQEAADIANGVVDNYKAMRDQEEAERNKRGMDSLRDQIAQQQKVVEDQRTAVQKQPQDAKSQHDLMQQQTLLDALNARFRQAIADGQLMQSSVRIISRAMALPE